MTDIEIDPHNSSRAIFNTGFGLFQTTNLAAAGTARTWTFFNDGLEESVPLGLHSPTAGPPLVSVIGDYTGFRHDDLNRSPLRGALSPGSGSTSVITGADLAPSKMIRQNSGTTLYSQDAAATWASISDYARAPSSTATTASSSPPTANASFGARRILRPSFPPTTARPGRFPRTPSRSPANRHSNIRRPRRFGRRARHHQCHRRRRPLQLALRHRSGFRRRPLHRRHSQPHHPPHRCRRRRQHHGRRRGRSGFTDATGTAARFNSPAGSPWTRRKTFTCPIPETTPSAKSPAGRGHHPRRQPRACLVRPMPGGNARFNTPAGLAVDSSGSVFVCDSGNHLIRKITSAGVVSTVAGLAGVSGTTDATGSDARFNTPSGITIDSSGNLYVADSGNHAIRKITISGEVTTFAGLTGTSGSTDATTTGARFNTPKGITIDATGTLHVADSGNHTIRKITSTGVVTTAAGVAGSSGNTTGNGSTARFSNPGGIAATPDGINIHVADTGNHTIRRGYHGNTLTPIADRMDGNRFYLWDGTAKRLLTSIDGGAGFSIVATGVNSAFNQFRTVPGKNGHIWAKAGDSGLYRSTNFGATFTKLSSVVSVYQFDFGKAAPSATHPSVFIWGKVGTTIGFFRSDDTGATWVRINDNLHNFGYQNDIAGDPRVHGRVYLATSGRGVVYGDFANPATPPSQSSQLIYDDSLLPGWTDASPSGTSLASSNPVRRGTSAVLVPSGTGKGLAITCPNRSLEGIAALAFWVNAGASAPPPLRVGASRGGIALEAAPIAVPATVGWQRVVIPFTELGLANITDLSGLRIESSAVNGVTPGAFSLDDIELVGADDFNGITTATITLSDLNPTYSGAPRPVTATTNPAGLPVLITYNGSSTAPTAAGTYTVSAVVDAPSIIGSATGTLVIAKANASILLGNLSPAADGTPKTPSFTTSPTGLAVSFTFNGSPTAPSYAGSYAIVATINDANYQGSTSSTMLIRQLALPGTDITGWVSNIPGKVTATNTSSPLLNPNDIADTFSTNTLQSFFNPVTLANVGDKITLTGGFQLSLAGVSNQGNWFRFGLFDNRGQAPNIITAWSGYTGMGTSLQERITAGAGPFSSGTDATPRAPDASPTPVSGNSPSGTPPIIFEETITRTATGVVLTFLIKRTDTNAVLMNYTYTDTSPNNNGVLNGANNNANTGYNPTYNTAGFSFGKGYISSTGAQAQFSNIQVSFQPGITAEPQSISFAAPADRPVTSPAFDPAASATSGLPVSFSLLSGPATLFGNTLTLTGTGTVTVRASQPGNLGFLPAPDVDQSFNVTKANATIMLGGLNPTYDGYEKSVTVTTNPSPLTNTVTYDGGSTAPTQAGSYTVTATIDDSTYQGSATDTLVIAKAPQSIVFAPLPDRIFGDAPFALAATAALPVTFSIISGPATLNGNILTLDGAGTVVVRASQAGDSNHLAAEPIEQSINVAKATAAITLDGLTFLMTGFPNRSSLARNPPVC
jgi:hypothetical protein